MNKKGYPATLQARQAGNRNAVCSAVYSARVLAPRAQSVADALLAAPHVIPIDQIAAEEIGSLVATLEAIDADLQQRGLTDKRGNARTLLDMRCRLSGKLERWLREFGATPASRAELVERMASNQTPAEQWGVHKGMSAKQQRQADARMNAKIERILGELKARHKA